jgi:peroxidase
VLHPVDGTNNNLANPNWGASNQPRVRMLPKQDGFYDGLNEPIDEVNSKLPSARRIMERIFSKARPHKDKHVSHILLEFGHFIVQDILGSRINETEPFDVPCDGNMSDYVFCPVTGARAKSNNVSNIDPLQTIAFHRDEYIESGPANPRSTINGMTSFLDLSNIYDTTTNPPQDYWEKKYPSGKIPLTEKGLLGDYTLDDGLKAGINTTPGAYAIYILFIRYHNKLAEEYQTEHPTDSDKDIFEAARRKTIAVYQSFVEEKYVPALLGDKLDDYRGYDASVDPSIDEFFAAMSFRYAHSSFGNLIRMVDKDYVPLPNDPLLLRDIFRNNVVQMVEDMGGIEPFLRGLTITPAKQIDASFVEDFNIWAEATSVIDVQRGRDVGLPRYNDVREAFGFKRMESMEELVADRYEDDNYHNDTDFILLVSALKDLYHDDIDLVDAYVGALIEAPITRNDNMGPLFTTSLKDQFSRLRDGDRFWFKTMYTEKEYSSFPDLSALVKMVCEDMELFPDDPYKLTVGPGEALSSSDGICASGSTSQLFLLK